MLDSADSVNQNENDDEFRAVFRDVQLVNCCYDEVLQKLTNKSPEYYYQQLVDVYCETVVEEVEQRPGRAIIPLISNGQQVGSVYANVVEGTDLMGVHLII